MVGIKALRVTMRETARNFGLRYASLREASIIGITPFKRDEDGKRRVWMATVEEVDKWSRSDQFKLVEREKAKAVKEQGQRKGAEEAA